MNITAKVMLVLSLLFSGVALADDDAKVEAEKLLEVLNTKVTMDATIATMLDAQIKQNPQIAPYKHVMLAFFAKYMSYESLKPDLISIYSTEFTASELKAAREFYSTPAGKKFIASMPKLMGLGAKLGGDRVQEHMPELLKAVEDEAARLQKLEEAAKPEPSAAKP